jgi:exosortase A
MFSLLSVHGQIRGDQHIHSKDHPVGAILGDWKTKIQLFICATCVGILYYDVFAKLIHDWVSLPDFSHGFFIPFISLYFVWERKNSLCETPLTPSFPGVGVLFVGLLLLMAGNLAAEMFVMRFSFLVVLSGIVIFLLGWTFFKKLLFPIGFLVFMIPIPSILLQKITFPMQLFASNVAAFSLQQIGIPVLREGNIIHLAHTTLEVAEACSGIRSLISLLALGTVFAYFTKKVLWERLIIVMSCFPIAIFVNALRVSATGVLANYYGIGAAQGFFHGFSGYILFLIALIMLMAAGYLLSAIRSRR